MSGVGGRSRVSSGGGGVMAGPGRKRPDEGLGRAKTEALVVGDGENEDVLKADPGRVPGYRATYPELVSNSAAMSWAKIYPTKVLGRTRSPWCPCMARGSERRRRCCR